MRSLLYGMLLLPALSTAGTAVFLGDPDEEPLRLGFERDRLIQDDGSYRFENGYSDWYSHRHPPGAYHDHWPDFWPDYQGDLYPGLADAIGTGDFDISLTLDPRSQPLGHEGGGGQRFGIYLEFEGDRPYILFGFDANYGAPHLANRPFAIVSQAYWTYYGDSEWDATGTAETLTLSRRGDVFFLYSSSRGSGFKALAGERINGEIHADLNGPEAIKPADLRDVGTGRRLSAITVYGESEDGSAFPPGSARIQSIVVRSPALDQNVNPQHWVPPLTAFEVPANEDAVAQLVRYSGVVTDEAGQPMYYAHVRLHDGDRFHTDITGPDGRYEILAAPGRYRLSATANGFAEQRVRAKPGRDFVLKDLGQRFVVGEDAPNIQSAIDMANAGDVIELPAGVYREHFELEPGIAIEGAGESTVLVGEAYHAVAIRPFMKEWTAVWAQIPMKFKSYLSDVRLSGFQADGGTVFWPYTAENLSDRIALLAAIDFQDVAGVAAILRDQPELANTPFWAPGAGKFGGYYLARNADSWLPDADEQKSVEIARLLLAAGADINQPGGQSNVWGGTPLHCAVWYGNLALTRFLIEQGADIELNEMVGGSGGTPMEWAVYQGERLEGVVEILIEGGAHYSVIDLLLVKSRRLWDELGDPNKLHEDRVNDRMETPLHTAVRQNMTDITMKLLELGADPEMRDGEGLTVKERAVAEGDTRPGILAALGLQ
ncbi:MAG: ankyrin repeat domain-containing protein [Pseudomonadota bacterium]